MPQGLFVGKIRVEILGELEMLRKLGIQPMKEVRVVPRQPLHPNAPFVVCRFLFMVGCSFCLQKEIVVQIQIQDIQPISTRLVKSEGKF